MYALIVHNIAGRVDRLDAIMEQTADVPLAGIFVLGNLASPPEASAPASSSRADEARIGEILAHLGTRATPIYLVPGEHDGSIEALSHAIEHYRGPATLYLLHRRALPFGDTDVLAGFGGKLAEHGSDADGIHFAAWEARVAFEHLAGYDTTFQHARRRILLLATPPSAQHVDRQGDTHVGVRMLNSLIRTYQVDLVCCGGPSEGHGIETVDGAQVINPGSVADGLYALLDLDQWIAEIRCLPLPLSLDLRFGSVLVALDGSPEAWHALELGANLAHRDGAQLTLVAAWERPRFAGDEPAADDVVSRRIAEADLLLARAVEYLPDTAVECEVVEGPAAGAILRTAQEHEADVIVMGARGLGRFRAALGSVSQRVVHDAACPVLITRETPHSAALRVIGASAAIAH